MSPKDCVMNSFKDMYIRTDLKTRGRPSADTRKRETPRETLNRRRITHTRTHAAQTAVEQKDSSKVVCLSVCLSVSSLPCSLSVYFLAEHFFLSISVFDDSYKWPEWQRNFRICKVSGVVLSLISFSRWDYHGVRVILKG